MISFGSCMSTRVIMTFAVEPFSTVNSAKRSLWLISWIRASISISLFKCWPPRPQGKWTNSWQCLRHLSQRSLKMASMSTSCKRRYGASCSLRTCIGNFCTLSEELAVEFSFIAFDLRIWFAALFLILYSSYSFAILTQTLQKLESTEW